VIKTGLSKNQISTDNNNLKRKISDESENDNDVEMEDANKSIDNSMVWNIKYIYIYI